MHRIDLKPLARKATSRPMLGWLTFVTTMLTLGLSIQQALALIPLRRALTVRRCTGAKDCSICTSCAGCAHCKHRGGKCGACHP
jgi:hypothetical protein